jgi:hypothetical protein
MFGSVMAGMGGLMAGRGAGMFGAGKPKLDIAGLGQALIGGYMAGRGLPGGGAVLGMMNQRQQQANEEAQYQRRRGEGLEDYAQKQKIEQQYGRAAQPHYFEDNSGNQWAIGPDGSPRMVHKDEFPFKLVPNGLGGVVPVDLRTLMASQAQGEILDALPPGAKPIGGPTPSASGSFRGPY